MWEELGRSDSPLFPCCLVSVTPKHHVRWRDNNIHLGISMKEVYEAPSSLHSSFQSPYITNHESLLLPPHLRLLPPSARPVRPSPGDAR